MRRNAIRRWASFAIVAIGAVCQACIVNGVEQPSVGRLPDTAAMYSDSFGGTTLKDGWRFDDPNCNDAFSLNARPGWLQIQVSGPNEDMWADDRGGAPILRKRINEPSADFLLETCVDLATSNGGYPVLNSIGGLVVRDSSQSEDASPFVLTFGVQRNWEGGTEVILQKPGHSFKWASPGANAVQLRLYALRLSDSSIYS